MESISGQGRPIKKTACFQRAIASRIAGGWDAKPQAVFGEIASWKRQPIAPSTYGGEEAPASKKTCPSAWEQGMTKV
jgi:hypothetical protein